MTKRLFPGILLFVLLVSAIVHYSQWDYPFLYIGYTLLVSVGYLLVFLSTKRGSVAHFLLIYGLLSLLIGFFLHTFPFSPTVRLMLSGEEFFLLLKYALINLIGQEFISMREKDFILPLVRSFFLAVLVGLIINTYGFSPYYSFPTPTGPYSVGTQTYEFKQDYYHQDILKLDIDSVTYMYQLFYPSPSQAQGSPIGFKGLKKIQTHTYEQLPIQAGESYPILFYSPGAGGSRFDNLSQIEELVSQGYIVAALEHPYLTDIRYADGQYLKAYNFPKSAHPSYDMPGLAHHLRIAQIQDVADEVLNHSTEGMDSLFSQIDSRQVGIFGWSIGGSAAVELCVSNPIFKAGINLDGWGFMELSPGKNRFQSPFLYLRSDVKPATRWDVFGTGKSLEDVWEMEVRQVERERELINTSPVPVFAYIIEEAFHSNIRDHGLLGVSRLGPIHPERCNEIVSQSVKRFFDQYLKGDSQEDFEEWAETEEELVRTNRIITRP
ncbi:MAG: hypothetical protein AAF655_08650 [Bacteroidota bacterium]